MKEVQWKDLNRTVTGEQLSPVPVGFIIDSPWLPGWYGINMLEYFSSESLWLEANMKVHQVFPDIIFLPGFWSEFGMCTEPSAFGAKCIFWKDRFPFSEKSIHTPGDIDHIKPPDPETDGLLPFMLSRLVRNRNEIEAAGQFIRFSVSRGPLNIASFLMGSTEFLTAMMMQPNAIHKLLRIITDFLHEWHRLQRDSIDSIDGILILDDIVGFLGEDEVKEFVLPYLTELFDVPAGIRLFHNDADCTSSVKYYPGIGINLFNPGTHMSINDLKSATEGKMTILGNIPPRDVLSSESPEKVGSEVKKLLRETSDHRKWILSCGGGMPPDVSTENINAFLEAARD